MRPLLGIIVFLTVVLLWCVTIFLLFKVPMLAAKWDAMGKTLSIPEQYAVIARHFVVRNWIFVLAGLVMLTVGSVWYCLASLQRRD